jgi:hypothetical protein
MAKDGRTYHVAGIGGSSGGEQSTARHTKQCAPEPLGIPRRKLAAAKAALLVPGRAITLRDYDVVTVTTESDADQFAISET